VDVRVAGHQVDTGESLREHAISRIEAITEKYFSRAITANVTFGRGPYGDFTCDIVAPVMQGVVLKSHHRAQEPRIALEAAADKIERQLKRYSKRLREHKGNGETPDFMENAGYTIFRLQQEPTADEDAGHPVIVAETKVDIPEASVSDAVMLMDLRNTNALMFRNSATGEYNMIYRREDETIGWVEPRSS
jgi:ribosomal subunit interface protein